MNVSGHLLTPAALSPGKSPMYTLDRRLGGLQSQELNLVTILIELSHLLTGYVNHLI